MKFETPSIEEQMNKLGKLYAQLEDSVELREKQALLDEINNILSELNGVQFTFSDDEESTDTAIERLATFLFISSFMREGALATWFPNEQSLRPPMTAEYILHLLLPKKDREACIGDLIEEYRDIYERFGKLRADFWFSTQVVLSTWPLLRRLILRIAILLLLGRWM
jgi:hypothetical protein